MPIKKKPVARRSRDLAMETEFWKDEFIYVIKKFYPITWKEELWKASLRLISDRKKESV